MEGGALEGGALEGGALREARRERQIFFFSVGYFQNRSCSGSFLQIGYPSIQQKQHNISMAEPTGVSACSVCVLHNYLFTHFYTRTQGIVVFLATARGYVVESLY